MDVSFTIDTGRLAQGGLPTFADRGDEDWANEAQALIDEAVSGLVPISNPVDMVIWYYEPNMRRDKDKVFQSAAFILGSLVQAGVLKSQFISAVRNIDPYYRVSNYPRVEVELREVEHE